MKRLFLILCLMMICNVSYANIASTGYVDSVVAGKQDSISDIETIRTGAGLGATAVQPSSLSTVAKTGSYNDLSNKPTIPNIPTGPNDGKKYSLVWNGNGFSFEEFTTGGGSTPIDWNAINAYLADPASNPNYTFASYGLDGTYCEGSAGYSRDVYGDNDWFGVDEGGSCSDPRFAGMVAGDWYIDIPSSINTKIEGRALCSSTRESGGTPNETPGIYCWCKMTSPATSSWVYVAQLENIGHPLSCVASCALVCVSSFQSNFHGLRSTMFSSIGQ